MFVNLAIGSPSKVIADADVLVMVGIIAKDRSHEEGEVQKHDGSCHVEGHLADAHIEFRKTTFFYTSYTTSRAIPSGIWFGKQIMKLEDFISHPLWFLWLSRESRRVFENKTWNLENRPRNRTTFFPMAHPIWPNSWLLRLSRQSTWRMPLYPPFAPLPQCQITYLITPNDDFRYLTIRCL